MSVTLEGYQNLTTRLANINSALNLFKDGEYPWALSIFDLGIITELLETPAAFFHYARCRVAIEKTKFEIKADEIDLLGLYFSQGLFFETDEYEGIDGAAFTGYSEIIDRYMFEKYTRGIDVPKPRQKMSPRFRAFLNAIERLSSPNKTSCVMGLLDLGSNDQEKFIANVDQMKSMALNKGAFKVSL